MERRALLLKEVHFPVVGNAKANPPQQLYRNLMYRNLILENQTNNPKSSLIVIMDAKKHSHYFKDVSTLKEIDVYRILELFNVVNPCIQHAVKKLLVAGGRAGGKDIAKDIEEAIISLRRWQEMRKEETRFEQLHADVETMKNLSKDMDLMNAVNNSSETVYRSDGKGGLIGVMPQDKIPDGFSASWIQHKGIEP
jgi:hypothetical protein